MLFVITDGAQTMHKGTTTPLAQAAKPLKDKGVEIWSVSVGEGPERSELESIASHKDNVVELESYDVLAKVVLDLKKIACTGGLVVKMFDACHLERK